MHICNWLGVALLPISSEVQITIQGRVRPDSLVWCGVVWCGAVVMIQDCMDTEQPGTSHDF